MRAALRVLLAAVLERTFGMALAKVEQLSLTLDDIAARGVVKIGALSAESGLPSRATVRQPDRV